jgi:hypothetical protein
MRKGVILLSLTAVALLSLSSVFDNEAMYGRIHADAQGYYGYLIAIFIEQSFDWEQVIRPYADTYFNGGGSDFTVQSEFGRINKYYSGTAILILPFFLITCLFAWLLGFPVDGYSDPFQLGIMFSALFYAGVGMCYLSRFFETKGISKSISLLTVTLLLFATGLFHYSIAEPAMSHVYSFGLVCVFMYRVDRWLTLSTRADLIWASVTFGLIVLVRPVNGLVIFSVPFIADGLGPLWDKLKAKSGVISKLSIGVLLVFGVLMFQSFMYMAQVAKPLVWSYQNEGFNFADPEILNVLFSYKKGFFVYTPLAFLSAIGLLFYLFKKPKQGMWLALFISLVVYVISCWWNWYYGGSFGHRAMIEYLPFFAFGLAFLLQELSKPLRGVVVSLSLVFVAVNLIQTYQYSKFILHWVEMDKDRYWEVFLKTGREYDGIFYRDKQELTLPAENVILQKVAFQSDLEAGTEWGQQGLNTEMAYSGKKSTLVNSKSYYGSTLGIPVSAFGIEGNKQLFVSAMVWSEEAFPDLSVAYSYRGTEQDYAHEYVGIGQLISKKEQWVKVEHIVPLTVAQDSTHTLILYPMSKGEENIYLDDIRYEIITLKE